MTVYHRGQQGDTPFRRNVRQPDKSGVRNIVEVDQFTEIGVYRYQVASFRYRNFQQSQVARIRAEGL